MRRFQVKATKKAKNMIISIFNKHWTTREKTWQVIKKNTILSIIIKQVTKTTLQACYFTFWFTLNVITTKKTTQLAEFEKWSALHQSTKLILKHHLTNTVTFAELKETLLNKIFRQLKPSNNTTICQTTSQFKITHFLSSTEKKNHFG